VVVHAQDNRVQRQLLQDVRRWDGDEPFLRWSDDYLKIDAPLFTSGPARRQRHRPEVAHSNDDDLVWSPSVPENVLDEGVQLMERRRVTLDDHRHVGCTTSGPNRGAREHTVCLH